MRTQQWLEPVLLTLCLPCFAAPPQPVKAYLERAQKLVVEHRRNVNRLTAPSELVTEALFAGSAFYLAGSDTGWISEGTGRAGGPMSVRHLSSTAAARAGDVVWLSYSAETYNAQLEAAAELEQKKCLVIAFGPRPTAGPPGFQHWIDSLTPWNADHNFTLLGNLLSFWTVTGEVAGASARRGKTLVFYQSVGIPEAGQRNARYSGRTFHGPGEPRMDAVQPGVAARAYLDTIGKMFRDIQAHEIDKILAVGKEMGRRSASHPPLLMVHSHMMGYELWGDGKWFQSLKPNSKVDAPMGPEDQLILLGYYNGVPLEIWEAVRRAKAKAVWIVVPKADQKLNFEEYGDVLINQQWAPGDAAVAMPGYDVRILPPSGVAQLFIYEAIMRAAGARP